MPRSNERSKKSGREPRRKRKTSQENHVTVRSKYTQTQSMNPSTAVTNLGGLSTGPTGIWATDQSVASLSDMFRLFKINNVTFEFAPMTTVGSALSQVPAGQLYMKTEGANAPSTLTDIETPTVSNVTTSWTALLAVAAEGIAREVKAYLNLKNSDFPILQGPSGPGEQGYLATQDDGTQTTFGTLFWNYLTTATSSTLTYYLRSVYGLDFKYILDPSSVSSKKHPNIRTNLGYHLHQQSAGAKHIQFGNGVLSQLTMTWMKIPSRIQNDISAPSTDSAPSRSCCEIESNEELSDDDRKVMSLKPSKVSQVVPQAQCSAYDAQQIYLVLNRIEGGLVSLSTRVMALEDVE